MTALPPRNVLSFTTLVEIQAPTISAHTWVILDGGSGRLIWGKNEHSSREVASITKMMTAYVVLRLIEQLKLDPLTSMVSVSEYASSVGGTTANLLPGDECLVIDLLYGLMLPSGNDAAVALAECFGLYLSFQKKNSQTSSLQLVSKRD